MAFDPGTPHRRSMLDLSNQLAQIFDSIPTASTSSSDGQSRTAPLGILPQLIASFESKRGIQLLMPEEMDQLIVFTQSNPEQRVGVDDLMQIMQFMQVGSPHPPTRTTTPPPSPTPNKGRATTGMHHPAGRRLPDSPVRVPLPRSTSQTSLSSPPRPSSFRDVSAKNGISEDIAVRSLLFPGGASKVGNGEDSEGALLFGAEVGALGPSVETRTGGGSHVEDEASRLAALAEGGDDGAARTPLDCSMSSSLSFRTRSSPLDLDISTSKVSSDKPPISSLRHNRPLPPARIRKISGDLPRSTSTESLSPTGSNGQGSGRNSPAFLNISTTPIIERPDSPSSPSTTISVGSPPPVLDLTSYHDQPLSLLSESTLSPSSPEPPLLFVPPTYGFGLSPTPRGEREGPSSLLMRREASNTSTSSGSSDSSRPTSLFMGEGDGLGGMFRGDSSSLGRAGAGEQFQMLLRQAHELARKLKDAESRLAMSASSYEEDHSELEIRLDEARGELQTKRREEKELRGAEKQHLVQIASLESDIAKLTKSLSKSRESYEVMKRSYQEQCGEAEKLRELVAEIRAENRVAEEAVLVHGSQVLQFERDRELLQGAIAKLQGELDDARRAQEVLDDQKQENLVLKETIDRLRFDMDELRSVGRKSSFLDNPAAINGELTSLGSELAALDPSSEEEEDVEDIVVTTHRRIKKRTTKAAATVQETIDADTQTESIATSEMDVQTDLTSIKDDLVHAPPLKIPRQLQEDLARGLGLDWSKLAEFVDGQKNPPPPEVYPDARVSSHRRSSRWVSRLSSRLPAAAKGAPAFFINVFPDSARPYVSQILDSTTTLALWSTAIFLTGIISGSVFLPLNHVHHLAPFHSLIGASDQAAWHQYNTFGSVWGQGLSTVHLARGGGARDAFFYWLTEVIWGGVNIVRRVPT